MNVKNIYMMTCVPVLVSSWKYLSQQNIFIPLLRMSRYPSAYGHTPTYKSVGSSYPSALSSSSTLGSSVMDSSSSMRDMEREMGAMKREMDRDFGAMSVRGKTLFCVLELNFKTFPSTAPYYLWPWFWPSVEIFIIISIGTIKLWVQVRELLHLSEQELFLQQ